MSPKTATVFREGKDKIFFREIQLEVNEDQIDALPEYEE
jgi:hypothetical protein